MALDDKNILITPNTGTANEPKIEFTGADGSGNDTITLSASYDGTVSTLSFEASTGQLFSVANIDSDGDGYSFSINDNSGIPAVLVELDGTVILNPNTGNVLIGTSTDDGNNLLQVNGNTKLTGDVSGITDLYIDDQIISTGDTNTYLQFHAADQFRVVTGGTERLEIKNTDPVVLVTGNLKVEGNIEATGTLDTTGQNDLAVTDRKITLNDGETAAGVNGGTGGELAVSGIFIERGTLDSASFVFDEADDKWKVRLNSAFNTPALSTIAANTFEGALSGNATTATTLATSRDFSVSGDATTASGVSFNGGGNVDLAITISDDAVTYAKMQNLATGNRLLGGTAAGEIGEVQVQTNMVANDAITYAKIQNVANDERILGRVSGANGVIEELTKSQVLTMLNVADGAQVNVATNLSVTADTNQLQVNSSTGTNVDLPAATASAWGVLSDDAQTIGGTKSFADDILPDTDNTGNVGTTSFTWAGGRFTNLNIDNTITVRGAVDLADNDNLRMGSADDYIIDFDATNLVIHQNVGGNVIITDTGDTTAFTFDPSTGNFDLTGTVDGRDIDADGTKLDGIEANAQVNVATNLSVTADTNQLQVNSSTGTNVDLPAATSSAWGVVSDDAQTFGGEKAFANGILLTSTAATTPAIQFNNNSGTDAAVDMAIRGNAEALDFYEPEQADKVHMRIIDDGGVWAHYGFKTGSTNNGILRLDSVGNLLNISNITLSGTVDGRDVANDGARVDELPESIARAQGWVPAYSNNDETTVYWNPTEEAVALENGTSDNTVGMAYPAFRVNSGEVVKFSLSYKGSSADTDGFYARIYWYYGDLPDGITHVSSSSNGTTTSSPFVIEDNDGDGGAAQITDWEDNSAVPSTWTNTEYSWTVPDLDAASGGQTLGYAYASIVILNWSGFEATGDTIYVKQPKISVQETLSSLGYTGDTNAQANVATNLGTDATASSLTITSSTGNNASVPAATTSAWGAMTDEDKSKLDSVQIAATVPPSFGSFGGAGTYGSTSNSTKIDNITIDAYGRITNITTGGTGDITGVTAGTGLSGGGTSGTVTLNVSGLTTSEIAAATLITSSETFTDNDTTLATTAAITDQIESFNYITNSISTGFTATGSLTGSSLETTSGGLNLTGEFAGGNDITIFDSAGLTATTHLITPSKSGLAISVDALSKHINTAFEVSLDGDRAFMSTAGGAAQHKFSINPQAGNVVTAFEVKNDEPEIRIAHNQAIPTSGTVLATITAYGATAGSNATNWTYEKGGELTFTAGGTWSGSSQLTNVTLDATGDITLDADGNQIRFKNGAGGDEVTHTLNDNATYEIDAPSTYTVDAGGDIVLDADGGDVIIRDGGVVDYVFSTNGTISRTGDFIVDVTGDITLDADGNQIRFKNGAGGDEVTHTLNDNGTYEIDAPSTYTIDAVGDIVLDADGNDIIFKNGGGADTVTHTLANDANFTITAPANYTVDASGDYTLNTNGGSGTTAVRMSVTGTDGQIGFNTSSPAAGTTIDIHDGRETIDDPTNHFPHLRLTNSFPDTTTYTVDDTMHKISFYETDGSKEGWAITTRNMSTSSAFTDMKIEYGGGNTSARFSYDGKFGVGNGISSSLSDPWRDCTITAAGPGNSEIRSVADVGGRLGVCRDDTTITTGELIGEVVFWSQEGNDPDEAAKIEAVAAANHVGGSSYATELNFYTTEAASTPVQRMTITADGNVDIGSLFELSTVGQNLLLGPDKTQLSGTDTFSIRFGNSEHSASESSVAGIASSLFGSIGGPVGVIDDLQFKPGTHGIIRFGRGTATGENPIIFDSNNGIGIGPTVARSTGVSDMDGYFHIKRSDATVWAENSSSGYDGINAVIENTSTTNTTSAGILFRTNGNSTENIAKISSVCSGGAGFGTADFRFTLENSGTISEKMRLTGDGNLLVGLSSGEDAVVHIEATQPTYTNYSTIFAGGTSSNTGVHGISLISSGDALGGLVGSNLALEGSTYSQPNTSRASSFIGFSNTTVAGKTGSISFGGLVKGTTTAVTHMTLDEDGDLRVIDGLVTAGTSTSGTDGGVIIQGYYGSGNLAVVGQQASSGSLALGYGVKPKSSGGVGSFVSSTGITIPKGAYEVTDDHRWYAAASSSVAIGNDVTMTETMRLEEDGDLHVENDVVAFSTTVSDQRLKDDVETLDKSLDKILQLRGVSFTWNSGSREGTRDIGVIAQEVETVIPEIVREKQAVLIDDQPTKTVDYEKLVAVLIEGMKEQQAQIDELREEIQALKGE